MADENPTNVGTIVGKLKIDSSNWHQELSAAEVKAYQLGRANPTIRVDADTSKAVAGLSAVSVATGVLQRTRVQGVAAAVSQASTDRDAVSALGAVEVAQRMAGESSAALQRMRQRGTAVSVAQVIAEQAATRALIESEEAQSRVSDSSSALSRMREQGRAVLIAQAMTERDSIKPRMETIKWAKESAQAITQDTAAKVRNADATDRVGASHRNATRPIHLLYSSLAMLAPAVVPLAGFAVAGAGALAMLGAAGVLAVKGISDEIKNGGPLAAQYSEGIGALKTQFNGLAQTSAVGMLGGFNRSIALLDSYMPSLNQQTGEYSRILGNMGSNTLSGLLGSFQTLNPVFQSFTTYLRDLTVGLGSVGSSQGMQKFGDYALATMPLVTSTLESLIAGVGNLLAALAPLGNVALTSLKVVGDILAVIPTDVLTVLVGGALGTYAAFSAWSALIPIIQSFGIMLNVSLGPIGLVVAGVGALIGIMIGAAASTDKATAATIGYIAALEQDNGVIGANVRAHAAQEISKSKAADAAKLLGINLGLVTSAALGEKDAIDQVNARLMAVSNGSAIVTDANGKQITSSTELGGAVKTLSEELGIQTGNLRGSVEQQKLYNEALDASGTKTAGQTSAMSMLASAYGTTVASVQAVTDAEGKSATQLEITTVKMQMQNDAAGLLKGQLDELNGKALSLEQAQTRAASSLNNVTKSFQTNGAAIVGTTEAAVANQSALQNKVAADQAAAEAVAKSTGSTEAGTKAYGESKTALENSMRAQGLLTEEVQAYINKLYNVDNLKVKPTKVDVDKAEAELKLQGFQTAIDRLTGKTVIIYTEERIRTIRESGETGVANSMDTANQYAEGNAYRANGGIVNYLSTGGMPKFVPKGTDTVPAMLTPGEIVIKKSSVDSIGAGPLLAANETGKLPGGNFNFTVNGATAPGEVAAQVMSMVRWELNKQGVRLGA